MQFREKDGDRDRVRFCASTRVKVAVLGRVREYLLGRSAATAVYLVRLTKAKGLGVEMQMS